MTEDQAKKKWCPVTQTKITAFIHTTTPKGQVNVMDKVEESLARDKCITSDCMMWKIEYFCPKCKKSFKFNFLLCPTCDSDLDKIAGGYCGLTHTT